MIRSAIILVLDLTDQFPQETKRPRKHKFPLKEFPNTMKIFTFNRQKKNFPDKNYK